jgi:hypothetical protein
METSLGAWCIHSIEYCEFIVFFVFTASSLLTRVFSSLFTENRPMASAAPPPSSLEKEPANEKEGAEQKQLQQGIQQSKVVTQHGHLQVTAACGTKCATCGKWWLYTDETVCNCCTGIVGCAGCSADTCWTCRQEDIRLYGANELCASQKLSAACRNCHHP